ncbi:MAG: hypothetical protein NXI32_11295 [bacterium]|nr:hypothetical protein [bacterium]
MSRPTDVSVVGGCCCGGSSAEPNFECERCRLVYFVLQVQQLRSAQKAFFRAGPDCRQDQRQLLVANAKHLERRIDEMVDRFTARPNLQQELFDA